MIVEGPGEFRNEPIDVGPSLAVTVAALVDEHAVDRGAQVRTVIEVEATQVKLVGLALAAMLADDKPGGDFKQLTGAVHGSGRQLLARNHARVRTVRDAELAQARAGDDDRGGLAGDRRWIGPSCFVYWDWGGTRLAQGRVCERR